MAHRTIVGGAGAGTGGATTACRWCRHRTSGTVALSSTPHASNPGPRCRPGAFLVRPKPPWGPFLGVPLFFFGGTFIDQLSP
jgi:hypothetical protein